MNQSGKPATRGGIWHPPIIGRILANEAYVGTLVYGASSSGRFSGIDSEGNIVESDGTRREQEAAYRVPGVFPPIIDRATFAKVQRRLAAKAFPHRRTRVESAILAGLCRCGHCGSNLFTRRHKAKGQNPHRYYGCAGGKLGICKQYGIRGPALEEAVAEAVRDVFLADDVLDELRTEIIRQSTAGNQQAERQAAETAVAKLRRKVERGRRNLLEADPDDVPEMRRVLSGWKRDLESAEAHLEDVDQQSPENAAQRADRLIGRD